MKASAEAAFAATVAAWSKVEPIRFGPVTQDHRYERIFYWPDPKGLGTRQMREALAKQDETVTDPDELAGKSVALQGLPALEYLLYGDGAASLAKAAPKAPFRCGFALAVAANLARIAQGGRRWLAGRRALRRRPISSGPDNSAYHTPKEVTLDLFKTFTAGIELVRDQKLAKPLGAKPERGQAEARALLAKRPHLRQHGRQSRRRARPVRQRRLRPSRAGEFAGVENSILFDLDHAIEVLRGIDQPIAEAVRNEDMRAKLEALRVALKSAATTAGDMISRGAGLSFGFNAMDGD